MVVLALSARPAHGGTASRRGTPGDEDAIAEAVEKLLSELGGPGREFSLEGAKQAALRLIQDPEPVHFCHRATLNSDPVEDSVIGNGSCAASNTFVQVAPAQDLMRAIVSSFGANTTTSLQIDFP
ncbi:hypothetical protein ABIB85_007669 [Bradyrhizobium sp. JR1.5]|uniref:hypothetical protein n=1 Tax=unclassified Bradyrhizobium TaxID=2631580 RepID=UPI003393633A